MMKGPPIQLSLGFILLAILQHQSDSFHRSTQMLSNVGKPRANIMRAIMSMKGGADNACIKGAVEPEGRLHTLWKECTESHPFLQGCTDGSLREDQFDTWLVQDYHFVKIFRRFVVDGVYPNAPEEHKEVIQDGISALDDELEWFQEKAKERGVQNLEEVEVLGANIKYIDLLNELIENEDYKILATAFWAIEAVYQVAWSRVLKSGVDKYKAFADRWGNDGFGEYVSLLEEQMNQSLDNCLEEEYNKALSIVEKICQLECDFWQMAFSS